MHQALSPRTQSSIRRTSEGWLSRLDGGDEPAINPVYLCPSCEERHDDRSEAAECCALHIDREYPCPACDELHHSEKSARECCGPGAAGLHKSCPVCDTKHNDAHEAADCCLWRDTTPHQRYLMAFRLEADPRITWQEAIDYAMAQPQPF